MDDKLVPAARNNLVRRAASPDKDDELHFELAQSTLTKEEERPSSRRNAKRALTLAQLIGIVDRKRTTLSSKVQRSATFKKETLLSSWKLS